MALHSEDHVTGPVVQDRDCRWFDLGRWPLPDRGADPWAVHSGLRWWVVLLGNDEDDRPAEVVEELDVLASSKRQARAVALAVLEEHYDPHCCIVGLVLA